jgi:DNA ligase-4
MGTTVKVFDLLYLNGQSLIHKSTKFRKRNLKSCIKEIHGRLEFVVDFEARTAKDVRKKMEDIMADRGEGLVMKHPDAGYVLNGRNKDWIKVKWFFFPRYGDTLNIVGRLSLNIWLVMLPCFSEFPVANVSRTTWVKPWMR